MDVIISVAIVLFLREAENKAGIKNILHEIEDLVEQGFKEIMLLGQNVNSMVRT